MIDTFVAKFDSSETSNTSMKFPFNAKPKNVFTFDMPS